jgi:hypothetical protein
MSNQETLNQLHDTIVNLVTHYCNGIITDLEFVYAINSAGIDAKMAFLKAQRQIHPDDLSGLLDANTGLRYPTTTTN